MKIILSKTNALIGLNCVKHLWLNFKKEKIPLSLSQELRFREGNEVGVLAQKLFKGKEIKTSNYDRNQVVIDTTIALSKKWDSLFEAGFMHKGMYCRCDVITKVGKNSVILYEVKSSTKVKDTNIKDLSYQANILKNCGYTVEAIKVIHTRGSKSKKDEQYNKDGHYYRGKDIDVQKYFKIEDVTKDVKEWEKGQDIDVWSNLYDTINLALNKREPNVTIGSQCTQHGVKCSRYSHCHKNITKSSLHNLSLAHGKKRIIQKELKVTDKKLPFVDQSDIPNHLLFNKKNVDKLLENKKELKENLKNTTDLEEKKLCRDLLKEVNAQLMSNKKERLTEIQTITVNCSKHKRTNFLNEKEIVNHLSKLTFPLSFIDFETFAPAIPMFKNTHAYQNLPFQFILFKREKLSLTQFDFLYEGKTDPREDLIITLLKAVPKTGSIVVYNLTFEDTVLKELGEAFPAYQARLEKLRARLWDLRVPFSKKWFAHYNLEGLNSIKKVLTVLAPEFSYHNLDVQKGDEASALYVEYLTNDSLTDYQRLEMEKQLIDYCRLDGLAMVKILENLAILVHHKLK